MVTIYIYYFQFSNYEPLPGYKINGEATLGENIADLGGIIIAYDAFKLTEQGKNNELIDGLTPEQRFFLGFSHIWAGSSRPETAAQMLIVDTHSPGLYRVNGPLSNLTEFYAAFDIKENDPMHRAENVRAKIW